MTVLVMVQVNPGSVTQHSSQLLRAERSQSRDGRDDVRVLSATDAAALSCRGGVAGSTTSTESLGVWRHR